MTYAEYRAAVDRLNKQYEEQVNAAAIPTIEAHAAYEKAMAEGDRIRDELMLQTEKEMNAARAQYDEYVRAHPEETLQHWVVESDGECTGFTVRVGDLPKLREAFAAIESLTVLRFMQGK